jgi:hypothetical protein
MSGYGSYVPIRSAGGAVFCLAPGQVAGIVQINFRLPQLTPGAYTFAVGTAEGMGDYDVITVNVR